MPVIDRYSMQCQGKQGYESKSNARGALIRIQSNDRRNMSVYFCPWCKLFHIGHDKSKLKNSKGDRRKKLWPRG